MWFRGLARRVEMQKGAKARNEMEAGIAALGGGLFVVNEQAAFC